MEIQQERGVRICVQNTSAGTKGGEGGARGAPCTGAEVALQPMM